MINSKLASLSRGTNDASPTSKASSNAPKRDRQAQLASAIPWALLLGFLLIIGLTLGDRLLPARQLAVANVVTIKADTGAQTITVSSNANPYEGAVLFQASGWVEPDPYAIKVTSLVDGVVEEVDVLEGETVRKGQRLAKLIDEDATLNLQTAENQYASIHAQCDVHIQQAEITKAEINTLKKRILVEEAKLAEQTEELKRLERLPSGAVPERDVVQTRLKVATERADVAALASEEEELKGKLRQLEIMQRDFDARMAEAETEVARRKLELSRTEIRSPIDGIVLKLFVGPGQKRMLGMDDPNSSTIATLYQPDKLQARIDVPLEEAAQLSVGQPVRIRLSFLPERQFQGKVTRIVGEADLQRNTLQAKVEILNPDHRLRPEMLCRAEFLQAPRGNVTKSAPSAGPSRVAVFVPENALVQRSGRNAKVWTLDEGGKHLALRDLTLGDQKRADHLLVKEGLLPGDRVVLDPSSDLKSGERVRPKSNPLKS